MKESVQNAAMLRYTEKEMLEEWKLRTGFFRTRTGCELVRDDGVDIDKVLQSEIDSRYERLLAAAPLELVPVMDVADDCTVTVDSDLAVTIVLPEDCVRVVELMLPGWRRSVTEFVPEAGDKARMQGNEWLRGGVEEPVCVAGHRCIRAYSAATVGDIVPVKMLVVCRPVAGTYLFAPAAWDVLLEPPCTIFG